MEVQLNLFKYKGISCGYVFIFKLVENEVISWKVILKIKSKVLLTAYNHALSIYGSISMEHMELE